MSTITIDETKILRAYPGVSLSTGSIPLYPVTEPSNPAEGYGVLWLSSDESTGGSLGDLIFKVTLGGTTKTATLASFNDL